MSGRGSSRNYACQSCSTCAPIRSSAAISSILYNKWMADRAFVQVPMQALATQWLQSFKEYPVRQKPASFNLDAVMAKLEKTGASAR